MNKKELIKNNPKVTLIEVTEEEIYNYELMVNDGEIEESEVEDLRGRKKHKRLRSLIFMSDGEGGFYCRVNKRHIKMLKSVLDGFRVKGRKLKKIPNRRRPPLAESVEVKEEDTGTKKKKG